MPTIISDNQTLIDQQIQSERESDFDANSAYGEVLDNSVQAGAQNIKIVFNTNIKKRIEYLESVAFGDDGSGMSPETVENSASQ